VAGCDAVSDVITPRGRGLLVYGYATCQVAIAGRELLCKVWCFPLRNTPE